MNFFEVCVIISSFSFFAYSLSYFISSHMKEEFNRFGLKKIGFSVIILEIIGATGLLIGLKYNPILIVSSLGLALLMFFGLIVRLKLKDSFKVLAPALFYFMLNAYIFWNSLN